MSAAQFYTQGPQRAYPALNGSPAPEAGPVRLFKMSTDTAHAALTGVQKAHGAVMVAQENHNLSNVALRFATLQATSNQSTANKLLGFAALSAISATLFAVLAPIICGILLLAAIVAALVSLPFSSSDAALSRARRDYNVASQELRAALKALDAQRTTCVLQLEPVSPTPLSPHAVSDRIARAR